MLGADGLLAPMALVAALAAATAGVVLEAVLFRGLFDIGRHLGLSGQRLGAAGALLVFLTALLLLELPIAAGVLRFGRKLESRLRAAFLAKVPRLGDRYFHSRLNSDMAERSHSLQRIRLLPELGGQIVRSTLQLVLTAAGIAWLDPPGAPAALLAAGLALALPLAAQPILVERDLKQRTHSGALSRFYLDALLGLVAIRTHGAERSVRREHENLLVQWGRAGLELQRAVTAAEALQLIGGFGLAAWLVLGNAAAARSPGAILLVVYWALNLTVLGQDIAVAARQYPAERNTLLRLLEPLGAREEVGEEGSGTDRDRPAPGPTPAAGVAVAFEGLTVRAAGHVVLEAVDLEVPAGSHVAIVGASGAGKSTLVGTLLGWHRPAAGRILVDGEPLDGGRLERLRRETAWVDPAIQLWNRSLLDNLRYGAPGSSAPLDRVIDSAELHGVLARLPDGLQTMLGEGGALVSGGEGQRVRLGRALSRSEAKLVILDEPFRGLDRERRRALLARVRSLYAGVTLFCITHDVGETRSFPRVVVVDGGRIAEDGDPETLAAQEASRYRRLLDAETQVREGFWSSAAWRRLRLERGAVSSLAAEDRT
jgi:ATP-binding cassette subfamily B protein